MKLKNTLILYSLIFSNIVTAKSQTQKYMNSYTTNNTFIEWESGTIKRVDAHVAFKTKGQGLPAFAVLKIEKLGIDFKRDNLYFEINPGDVKNIQGLEFRFSESRRSDNYLYYTFPFFTDFEFNILKSHSWNKYSISSGNLKLKGSTPKSIKYLTIYLNDKKTKLTFKIKKIYSQKKIQNAILSLTFDDGPIDNMLAAKILSKYNIPATAYIMPNFVGHADRLSVNDMKTLKKLYNWQVDSHHETPFTFMDENKLKNEILSIHQFLKNNDLKKDSFHLAYPLGKTNPAIIKITQKYFSTARVASGGLETLPPANPHMLRSFNVLNTTKPKELKRIIKIAKDNKQWLILMLHHINESPKQAIDYSISNLEKLAKIINDSKIEIKTIDEVWKSSIK